jgi:protein phosphatase
LQFESLAYRGLSAVKVPSDMGSTGIKSVSSLPSTSTKFTITTKTSSSSQWENNILEKMRVLLTSTPKSLHEIFNDFDEDGNGYISAVEFRNAIRKLGIGLSSRDIDALLAKIDTNQDGRIDYVEFMSKFKTPVLDERL